MYLLDTNAVIALIKNNPNFIKNLRKQKPSDIFVSSIVMFELYFGAYKSLRVEHNLRIIEKLPFEALDLTKRDGQIAGEIRSILQKMGKPIGPYDVLIAGQAVSRGLVLVTNNCQEFERVENLKIEDWQ